MHTKLSGGIAQEEPTVPVSALVTFNAKVHEQMFSNKVVSLKRNSQCSVPNTLTSRRAISPLVRLVERKERREASDHSQDVLPQNWGGTEQNRTVTCMVLKAKANDRRKNLALSHDEFRGL
ncbi:uncharacterized protein TNCV_1587241 [Trichonephila clavipes]|nr:uncharacterized protein TNCV_1587241 [Trichonephila clavipes]